MKARRPRVTLNPGADRHSQPGERIVEFYDDNTQAGGLISLRSVDGALVVELYRLDPEVTVKVAPGNLAESYTVQTKGESA